MEKRLKEELYYTSSFLKEENRKAKKLIGSLATSFLVGSIVCLSGCIGIEDENKDSDNDGIR